MTLINTHTHMQRFEVDFPRELGDVQCDHGVEQDCRIEEHEPLHERRTARCELECEATTERMAADDRRRTGLHRRAIGGNGPFRRGVGELDRRRLETALAQAVGPRSHRGCGT